MHAFIRQYPFATVVANTSGGLSANHIPLYLNTENKDHVYLQGHIARSNNLWEVINGCNEVLVIFQGSNAYITPSWYPAKKEHGKVVPTWNYTAVHVKGKIEFIHDPEWKMALLHHLTLSQEQGLEHPWFVSDAPQEFIEKLLPAIVGFEIVIDGICGKFKLSQNQSVDAKAGVVDGLKERGHEMAGLISTV